MARNRLSLLEALESLGSLAAEGRKAEAQTLLYRRGKEQELVRLLVYSCNCCPGGTRFALKIGHATWPHVPALSVKDLLYFLAIPEHGWHLVELDR